MIVARMTRMLPLGTSAISHRVKLLLHEIALPPSWLRAILIRPSGSMRIIRATIMTPALSYEISKGTK